MTFGQKWTKPPRMRDREPAAVIVKAERRGTYAHTQTVAKPKPPAPVRSERYRRLVAKLPCIACGIHGYSQAAHPPPTGKGIKEDDRECFPLCAIHPASVSGMLVDGCHAEFDRMQMMPREQMREQAEVWGAKTRSAVRMAGEWPELLAELDAK